MHARCPWCAHRDPDPAAHFDGSCNIAAGDVLAFPGLAPFSIEVRYQPADLAPDRIALHHDIGINGPR